MKRWIGGKDRQQARRQARRRRGDAASGKTPVIGAIERKGNVVARVLERASPSERGEAFVREVVSDKVSLLATDEAASMAALYGLPAPSRAPRGTADTLSARSTRNTIEGFWSIFKRGIVGSFHKVSRKYLPLYVAEFQFRYNNRNNPDIFGTA